MRFKRGFPSTTVLVLLIITGCVSTGTQSASSDALTKKLVAGLDIAKIVRDSVAKAEGDFVPVSHDTSVRWKLRATTLMDNDLSGSRMIAPDKLLICIYGSNPRLIDTVKGSLLWEQKTLMYTEAELAEHKNDNKLSIPPTASYPSYGYITTYLDLLVLRAEGDEEEEYSSRILAADIVTGNKQWSVKLEKKGELHLIPFPQVEVLVAVQQDKSDATLTALNLSTGAVVWKNEYNYGSGTDNPPVPTIGDDTIWLFYDGIAQVSAANGKVEWHRPEILAGAQSPPMQLDEGRLIVLDGKNTLHVLDANSGATLVNRKQRDEVVYTNIYPLGDRIYLRCMGKGESKEPLFLVSSVQTKDGKELWADTDKDPSVSNIIDEDGSVYFSTPFTVIALNRETGVRQFTVRASDVGKSFPVRIKKYKNRIVYIGELVIAAFDAKTGAKVYRHGFDPVHQTAHMDALDESIEKLEDWLSWWTGPFSGGNLSGANTSGFFIEQSLVSQNQSNYLRQESVRLQHAYSSGDRTAGYKSDIARLNSKIDSAFSDAQFSMGMAFMTVENIRSGVAKATAADRERLQKLLNIRKLLYSAYVVMQQGDYVYRPTNEAGMIGISIIHLPSGRASYTEITPEYHEIGIFNLVDYDKRIIYHPAIQKEPSLNSYFVARPVTIPK